jgi:hypothetical protein
LLYMLENACLMAYHPKIIELFLLLSMIGCCGSSRTFHI